MTEGNEHREAPGVPKAPPPDELLQSLRAWQAGRTLLTAIELDLFTAIGTGATSVEVARRLAADPRGVDLLLHAVAGLGLVEKHDDLFRNGPVAARYLRAGSEDDQRAGLMHTAALWHRWSHLTECVRSGQPAPRGQRTPGEIENFIAAMQMNALARAPELASALDLTRVNRILDVGGGSGAYSIALVQAAPREATAEILDLEDVLPITTRHVTAAGLSGRITFRPGDLTKDDLGTGFDLVLISAICHMNGPEENADLVARGARALAPGGRLVIHDHLLTPDRTSPLPAALFSINMLVNTPAGRSYAAEEYFEWMKGAGLVDLQKRPLSGPTGLVIGSKR